MSELPREEGRETQIQRRRILSEALKKVIGLDFAPRWQTIIELSNLIEYLRRFDQSSVIVKSLGELEEEIKPHNFREFEAALYMLVRHNFIDVSVPYSIVEKPRSILKGERWKPVRAKISEIKRTRRSAGEIILHYLQATRKDKLRIRRRSDVKDLLTFQIIPKKLTDIEKVLRELRKI